MAREIKYPNMQISKYANIQICKYPNMQRPPLTPPKEGN